MGVTLFRHIIAPAASGVREGGGVENGEGGRIKQKQRYHGHHCCLFVCVVDVGVCCSLVFIVFVVVWWLLLFLL